MFGRIPLPLSSIALACWLTGCGGHSADYSPLLQGALDRGLTGLALVVDRPGQPLWAGSAGHADLLSGRELSLDDPFHLASVTKSITAVATLRLIDRGALGLDDRVVDILDAETTRDLPAIDRITVRHLLDHSSGLYSFNNNREYWRRLIGAEAFSGRGWTTAELLDFVRANEPAGEPGTGFYYADTNYVLLGEILATVTGDGFKAVVRREVFEPLEMESAYFYSDYRTGSIRPDRPPVEGYVVLSDIMRTFDIHPDFPSAGDGLLQATDAHERSDTAAGVVATAPDMLEFARALFRDGFLSTASQALLREPAVRVNEPGDEAGGVLRAYARPSGVLLTAEGDGPGGVHTLLAYHPDSDSVIVAFTNIFGRFDEMDILFDQVVEKIVGR